MSALGPFSDIEPARIDVCFFLNERTSFSVTTMSAKGQFLPPASQKTANFSMSGHGKPAIDAGKPPLWVHKVPNL
jgi:hypothetical protein